MWNEYFSKAQSNLRVADRAYLDREPDPSVSRACYAAFQAAIAALLRLAGYHSRDDEWGHDEVAAQFSHQLTLRRKFFGHALAENLYDLMENRHRADYKPASVGMKVADRCLRKASNFVAAIEKKFGESEP